MDTHITPSLSELVQTHGVTMRATWKDTHTDDDNWTSDRWTVILRYQGRSMRCTFHMGTGHYGAAPDIADVLDSLLSDSTSVDNALDFADWCRELGYETDSRKGERIYKACAREAARVRALLGDDYETFAYASR